MGALAEVSDSRIEGPGASLMAAARVAQMPGISAQVIVPRKAGVVQLAREIAGELGVNSEVLLLGPLSVHVRFSSSSAASSLPWLPPPSSDCPGALANILVQARTKIRMLDEKAPDAEKGRR